jgi:hypothetical protein
MLENWDKVFETNQVIRAEQIKDLLEINDIQAVILNKQTSSFVLGYCEVYVPNEVSEAAKNILKNEEA